MIGIVDYGLGNLTSVAGAVRHLGHTAEISSEPERLSAANKLILPGVGAFGDGMANLKDRGLIGPLTDLVVGRGKPVLGICLGFQLLGQSSDEFGDHEGLGWIEGHVRRLTPNDPACRVPHVGWNGLEQTKADCILFDGIPDDALFYYVHSHAMVSAEKVPAVGLGDHGGPFVAAIQKGSIFGTQFHPEKSQRHGLTVLGNFLEKA